MNKKKTIINAIFLISVFAATMYFVFKGQDLNELLRYIRSANPIYWITGIVFVVFFILGESVIIFYMMRSIGENVKLTHCFLYSFVGFFFSCITPSATGGQPAQIYFMKRDKISIPVATVILMIVTITYKLVLVITGVLVFWIRPKTIMKFLSPVWGWCCLGIALNVVCVILMLVLVFHPTLAKNIMTGGIREISKFIKLKRADRMIEKIECSMKKYQNVASYLSSHKKVIGNVLVITFIQRYLLFVVTYLTYLSFGYHEYGIDTITILQGMISVSVDMLPLPGGMGISENLFLLIFEGIFDSKLLLPAMIVSRGIGYYTQLLMSAVMTVVAFFTIRTKEKENI